MALKGKDRFKKGDATALKFYHDSKVAKKTGKVFVGANGAYLWLDPKKPACIGYGTTRQEKLADLKKKLKAGLAPFLEEQRAINARVKFAKKAIAGAMKLK